MDRMPKLAIIALIAVAAIVGAIMVADNFDDREPTVRAEVIEIVHGNTLVLDIGPDDLDDLGAEIGDDILVKTDNGTFSVLLSPDSRYKGYPSTEGTSPMCPATSPSDTPVATTSPSITRSETS